MVISPTLLVLLAVVLLAAFVALAIIEMQDRRKAMMAARIRTVMEAPTHIEEIVARPEREDLDRRLSRLMRSLPANMGENIENAMATTGGTVTPAKLLIVTVVAIGVTFVLGTFFRFPLLVIIGLVAAIAYFAPLIYFRRARGIYRTTFLEVFPDALDLIARIVRAGVPVSTGIEVAGKESPEPVKSVFAELASQNRVGITFEDSLNRMVKRLNIQDFSFFASALVLQRESGGNISETVSNLSAIVRKRKELRKKGEALTAEARTVAGVLAALPFLGSGLVALVNFPYISLLFTDTRGNIIMGIAMTMLLIGMGIMRAMVNNALR
jgi:Flp pilus assembly protein TadB